MGKKSVARDGFFFFAYTGNGMDHPITAIALQAGFRLFATQAAIPPGLLALHVRMLSYSVSGGVGELRFALSPSVAKSAAPVLFAAGARDCGEKSKLTLYGIGIRQQQETMRYLRDCLIAAGCLPDLVFASEEEVSFLLPHGVAENLFDRFSEEFSLL